MKLIAQLYRILFTATLLPKCLKGYVLAPHWQLNVLTVPKNWWNLNDSSFTKFFDFWGLIWEKKSSLLLRFEILALFVNTVTSHGKYACYKRENFPQAIQMQLSKNQICFFNF